MTRDRTTAQYNALTGTTFISIIPQSGKVTFTQCVFRNAMLGPSGAESPSPQIRMGDKEGRTSNKYTTGTPDSIQYNLGNLNYYCLPNVFVDDPPLADVDVDKNICSYPYLQTGIADHTTIDFAYAFIVFRLRRRTDCPIRIHSSNSMRWNVSWSHLGKLVLYYEYESGRDSVHNNQYRSLVPISILPMSTARYSQSSIPSNALNNTLTKQSRVEIVNKDANGNDLPAPSWLQSPKNIMTNTISGYDATTGTYNHMVNLFNRNDFVFYNGQALTV